MLLEIIDKKNISEQAFLQIKKMISDGVWKQGDKILSENELAQKMGISRISVRSAIQRLSSLGIVESKQGEGTYVCNFDAGVLMNSMISMIVLKPQDIIDILEFRIILECENAYLAAQRASKKDVEMLKKINDLLITAEPMSEESTKIDISFHQAIAKATQNPLIENVFEIISEPLFDSMRSIAGYYEENNALRYHFSIAKAIEDKNPTLAKNIMKEHLKATMQIIEKNLK